MIIGPLGKHRPAAPAQDTSSGAGTVSWWGRLRSGLRKTRHALSTAVSGWLARGPEDEASWEALETQLILADVGVDTTEHIVSQLKRRLRQHAGYQPEVGYQHLHAVLVEHLRIAGAASAPWRLERCEDGPRVVLMVGVNGTGKTTTLGKLAHAWQAQGHKILMAAGDTFRAAAIEQLQAWGQRTGVEVVAQKQGSDPAAVIFDAYNAARHRGVDVVLADTAGRLHTKHHLMDELSKVQRVLRKCNPDAPHEVWMVLDASIGQNTVAQAQVFQDKLGLTGLVITKLDGTAKGGVVLQLCHKLGLPVRYVGVGEGLDDLKPFVAEDFVSALLGDASLSSSDGMA